MNHVNLIGKMSSEPRFYEMPNGKKVAQFTLTTREIFLDEEGNAKFKKHWHRLAAWGRWAKVLEELGTKDMEIAIEGRLTSRFYEKKGEKKIISEVEVNDLVIL